jgi:hypothetical protein
MNTSETSSHSAIRAGIRRSWLLDGSKIGLDRRPEDYIMRGAHRWFAILKVFAMTVERYDTINTFVCL